MRTLSLIRVALFCTGCVPLSPVDKATSLDTGTPSESCVPEAFSALATTEALAASPRADAEAEGLALCMGDQLVADEATVLRVQSDLALLRRSHGAPALTWQSIGLDLGLIVGLSAEAASRIEAGADADWSCVTDWLGATAELHSPGASTYAVLRFTPLLDAGLLVAPFETLDGVAYAEPDAVLTTEEVDQSTLWGRIEGETYTYVYDDENRIGSSVRSDHIYTIYTTDADGAVTEVGSWHQDDLPEAWKPYLACGSR